MKHIIVDQCHKGKIEATSREPPESHDEDIMQGIVVPDTVSINPAKQIRHFEARDGGAKKHPRVANTPQIVVRPSFSATMRARAIKRALSNAQDSDSPTKRQRGVRSSEFSPSNHSPVKGRPPESG